MTSSYSTDLKLELMVTGENAGTWGDKTNTNLNLLQQAIAGYQAVSIAGGAQTTALVMSDATISNARNAVVKLTGTITGNQIVTIPNGIEKTYIVENGTSGAFTVQFKTVSGTGPTFSTTDKGIKIVYSNGTDVIDVNANLSGPTLASDLNVNGKSIISTSNGDITIAPNGSGKVFLDADTVRVGDSGSAATLTTNGAGNLTINTNSGTNSGTIVINQGTNGNIAITPNGTGSVVLDGLNWPQADGTNGQVLQTNGSGQLAFATAAGGATQLVQSLPLATGVSYTAGQLASIGASGEIVAYPTLNTFGTQRLNSTTTVYSAISTDGSRALRISGPTQSGDNFTWTFNGVAISNSATPTNGGTSVTHTQNANFNPPFGGGGGASLVAAIAASETKFQIYITSYGNNPQVGCDQSNQTGRNSIFTVVVDASGNCTKGNVATANFGPTGGNGSATLASMAKLTPTIFVFNYASTQGTTYKQIVTLSSTSTTTLTSDADAEFWSSGTGQNSVLTTNNILGVGFGNTWRTAAYTASPIGIGTKTDVSTPGDYASSGAWTKMADVDNAAAEYALQTYIDTSGQSKYITYSINQTTGALTQVETGALSLINSTGAGSMIFKDKNSFLGGSSTFSFTNGARNTPTFNAPYTFGTVVYNSGDLFFNFTTSPGGFPQNQGYTVNAYATNSANYVGVVKTTDSTSPIDIVTDGVAGGFTSLTPGTVYYSTSPFDGTVTTSSGSGLLIGKAVSATEILLQRSNTQ
jgi:hypothetical protein